MAAMPDGTAQTANLLSDPTRVRILDALRGGPLRTSELAAATGATAAALTRHLNQLRAAGVITRRDVDGDGRGRAYELRPAALDALAGWAVGLAAASNRPRTRALLSRMGGFLDAFAASDVGFFERHLRADATLVFPGATAPVDKQGCLASVASHPPYRRYEIVGEPLVRLAGPATVITVTAEVATEADEAPRSMFITTVIEETDPWQLVHLQWTPAGGTPDD
jgi:DNA-binding transcriptional ArsR family regulator